VSAEPSGNAGRCAIAVMAKAPVPGRVKTRLSPPLSPDEATALSGCFLRDVTANLAEAARAAPIDAYVAFAPAGGEALLRAVIAPGTKLVLADGSPAMPDGVERFGRSLLHAARALFALGYDAVGLLNSDSPTLPTALLVEAARALAAPGERVVLGPADDGGYYLLAMKAPHAALFRDIDWSTERVASQTSARAAALGLERVTLPTWYDVDDAASLQALLDELDGAGRPAGFAAPATARWLAQHDIRSRLAPTAQRA
jgi:rSAM/selenodomain-associated transferase 1